MTDINLLLLAPHWKVSLVRAFQESWSRNGLAGNLVGADSRAEEPSLQSFDHKHTIPRFDQPECRDALLALCRTESIHGILPFTNRSIDFLDHYRTDFSETQLYLSDPETVTVCHDKMKLADYLESLNIASPRTWSADTLPAHPHFPLFGKPRVGEGSQHTFTVEDARELEFYVLKFPDHVYQEKIIGREYSIDWFSDRQGRARVTVPRERVRVRAGEVWTSRIELSPALIDATLMLGDYLKLRGPATLQGILDSAGRFHFTDINLRMGSGYGHTLHAGADVPMMIHRELAGESLDDVPAHVKNGSVMTRYLEARFQD